MKITDRLLAANHSKGRQGHAVDMVTIHVTEGSASSVRSWFAAAVVQVSAHYMVTVAGTVDQFVDEDDTAWHNGRVHQSTAPLVVARPHVNPNLYSIGIEHEGTGDAPLTALQRDASVELIRDICTRRSIPIDRAHIVGHHEVFRLKSCPGAIDVDALVALVQNPVAPRIVKGAALRPRIVWSAYFNDYLVVVKVDATGAWWFVPMNDVVNRVVPTLGTVPLASMPVGPP